VPVPLALRTRLQRFDVLFVSGVKGGVDKLAAFAGRVARPGACADLLVLALGMVLGLALGTVGVPLAAADVKLGPAGGLLVAGLLISAAAPSLRLASFAPCAARGLLEEFGLVMFVATVALQAGALLAIQGSTELVAKLFVAGFVTGTLPLLVAWTVGLHAMKISPAILVGAVAGARAHTAPARDAARVTGSSVPWIGFPHAYAAATALLGAAGFIAMLVAR
jgi:putative transport protein